ncbi:MAG TPA: hypothetical protein PKI32_05890 [Opitutales bacterium]|nr:hypothetical protein [Opitutales bacterium]
MRIHAPEIVRHDGRLRLSAPVESSGISGTAWFDVPGECADWVIPGRSDGFLAGLVLQAMALGEDVFVDGVISPTLLEHLNASAIPLVAAFNPRLGRIRIHADLVEAPQSAGTAVATGFSAGVDSFATLIRHHDRESRPERRITHLLFNNAGSHGTGEKSRILYARRLAKVAPFAAERGIPLLSVDSNIHEILPIDFIQMHSALNAAVPLVLQGGIGRFHYSSTYACPDCGIGLDPGFDIARIDPSLIHLFSTETTSFESSGGDLTRVDKTRLVAECPDSERYLSVCADPDGDGGNCSECFKCRRTMLTLELLGVADRFRNAFDFSKFDKVRGRYIASLAFAPRHSFSDELAALVADSGGGFAAAFVRISRGLRLKSRQNRI